MLYIHIGFDNFAMTPKIWEGEDLYAVLISVNDVLLNLQLIHQRAEYSLREKTFSDKHSGFSQLTLNCV